LTGVVSTLAELNISQPTQKAHTVLGLQYVACDSGETAPSRVVFDVLYDAIMLCSN